MNSINLFLFAIDTVMLFGVSNQRSKTFFLFNTLTSTCMLPHVVVKSNYVVKTTSFFHALSVDCFLFILHRKEDLCFATLNQQCDTLCEHVTFFKHINSSPNSQ